MSRNSGLGIYLQSLLVPTWVKRESLAEAWRFLTDPRVDVEWVFS